MNKYNVVLKKARIKDYLHTEIEFWYHAVCLPHSMSSTQIRRIKFMKDNWKVMNDCTWKVIMRDCRKRNEDLKEEVEEMVD